MFGVYMLYGIRKLKNPFIGEFFALALCMAVLSFFISLPHVISNMMSSANSVGGSYDFFTTAFSKTQTTVKLITLGCLAALVLFVRNVTLSTTGLIRNRMA
jgi:hypothetical protein